MQLPKTVVPNPDDLELWLKVWNIFYFSFQHLVLILLIVQWFNDALESLNWGQRNVIVLM